MFCVSAAAETYVDQQRQQLRQVGNQSVHHRILHVQHREDAPELYASRRQAKATGRLRRHEDVGVLRELQHDGEEVVQTAQQRVHSHVQKRNQTVADDGERLGVRTRHQPGKSLRVKQRAQRREGSCPCSPEGRSASRRW